MDLNTFNALQILALKALEKPNWDDFYRKVCRWYSYNCCTPLHIVSELQEEDVLRNYFEGKYGELYYGDSDLHREKYQELKRDLILAQLGTKETEEEDDEWVRKMEEEVNAKEQKIQPTKETKENPNLIEEKSVNFDDIIPSSDDDQD